MAEYADREHYIPLRKDDLAELLGRDRGLAAADREPWKQFCRLVAAVFHFEYHQRLEELKNEYAPFDPDAVTRDLAPLAADQRGQKLDGLFERFVWLMERANFKHLEKKAIEDAMTGVSDWGLNMEVDFNVFERLEMFVRGDVVGSRSRRRWWRFFRLETIKLPIYQRLVLILKLRKHKRLGKDIDVNDVYLKLFKDIPRMDLEMLLPGARLQMPGLTRLKLSGSLLGGLGYIVFKILSELAQAITLGVTAFWGPLAAVLGYGYKQYYGYQTTKTTYSLQLTQSLYFQNLDNNAGVLYHLLDEAEEQECREVMLAYFYLWQRGPQEGWTAAALDDYIEMELERLANVKVDFEVGDALAKLERLNLVSQTEGRYRAVPLAKALEALDYTWDNYFQYNQAATLASGAR